MTMSEICWFETGNKISHPDPVYSSHHQITNMDYKLIALTKRVYNHAYDAILPTRPELSQAGKTVLITAATGGIAYAIARNFGIAGADKVIITGRSEERLKTALTIQAHYIAVLERILSCWCNARSLSNIAGLS